MAYTTVDNPELYFQVKLHTGDGGGGSLTFDGSEDMAPDLVWSKSRSGALNHTLFDSVRGAGSNKELTPNGYGAEGGAASATWGYLSAFDSDGFTWLAGSTNAENFNTSSATYVHWCWKAGTTSGITGSPSITPTSYSFNSTSGFSIIKFDGTGSAATLPHGLGTSDIGMMIIKNTADVDEGWSVFHKSLGNTYGIKLNGTSAASDDTKYWNDTSPTSTLFTIGDGGEVNGSSNTMIAYCFANVQGFSKFGSYTGNGNADGTFVYTGFRPAMVILKKTSGAALWYLHDNKRNPYNIMNKRLYVNNPAAEASVSEIDYYSNGFKLRTTETDINGSGSSYIYMAFAEAPFVNSNGVPNNAR